MHLNYDGYLSNIYIPSNFDLYELVKDLQKSRDEMLNKIEMLEVKIKILELNE